jgi:hypothetical protein
LLPAVARAIPKHRVVVRTSGRLSFCPLRLPYARRLRRPIRAAPRCRPPPTASGGPLRPPNWVPRRALYLPVQNRVEPSRETRFCVKSGEPPPPPPRRRRPAAAPAPTRPPALSPPSDRNPTAQNRSNPESNQPEYRSTVASLQNSPYVFPDSTRSPLEFKSIRVLVLFLLFRPL